MHTDPTHRADDDGSTLTWLAHPRRELLRLTWPIAVSMLSFATMTLVDTLFVGRLGTSALAGVGLGGVCAFTLVCFGFGLLEGVKVRVSQAQGAGQQERTGDLLRAGVILAWATAGLTLALSAPLAVALPSLAAGEAAGRFAATYFSIRVLGAPLLLTYVAIREARYGVGDSRTPMVASLVANATNIALDYLLLVVLDLGAAGAAWATVCAQATEALLLIVRHRAVGLWPRGVRWADVRSVLEVGWPSGVQWVLEVGSFALLAAMLSMLSERDIAAHQIAVQIVHFGFLPVFALGEAASVLAGQAVGADRDRLVHRVARDGALIGASYAALFIGLTLLAGRAAIWGFTSDPALHRLSVQLLWVCCGFLLLDVVNIVFRGVLRGAGDVRYAATVGIAASWLCTPPLAWLLAHRLALGAVGGWLGIAAEVLVAAALMRARLQSGRWLPAAARSRAAQLRAVPAAA